MTLPSTNKLKRIRAKSTPGPWATQDEGFTIIGPPVREGNVWFLPPIACMENERDDELITLAPELLDELIRRREEAGE